MKGWFTPYRIVNVTGTVFLGLFVLFHLLWPGTWLPVHLVLMGAVSAWVATQILRNMAVAETQRKMTFEILGNRNDMVEVASFDTNHDIFNTLGRKGNTIEPWRAVIALEQIAWIEVRAQCVVLHLRDGSHIAGSVANDHVKLLTTALNMRFAEGKPKR